MKRRLRRPFLNVAKMISVLLLIVILVISGVFAYNYLTESKTPIGPNQNDDKTQTFEYSINNYTLYDLDTFDFRFILASIHVTSNQAINLSLTHFVTSEDIQLNSVDIYLQKIDALGYNFGNNNVTFSLTSTTNELDATLFIPVVDSNLKTLDLNININPKKTLSFDLENPTSIGVIGNLGINPSNQTPSDTANVAVIKTLMISPSEFYQIDENGSRIEANFTAQSNVFGVKLDITNKLSESFRILKATLKAKDGTTFDAIDKSYLIDGIQNLNNIYIENDQSGYLFFEILGSQFTSDQFSSLDIYLSNITNGTPLSVDLGSPQ